MRKIYTFLLIFICSCSITVALTFIKYKQEKEKFISILDNKMEGRPSLLDGIFASNYFEEYRAPDNKKDGNEIRDARSQGKTITAIFEPFLGFNILELKKDIGIDDDEVTYNIHKALSGKHIYFDKIDDNFKHNYKKIFAQADSMSFITAPKDVFNQDLTPGKFDLISRFSNTQNKFFELREYQSDTNQSRGFTFENLEISFRITNSTYLIEPKTSSFFNYGLIVFGISLLIFTLLITILYLSKKIIKNN